MKQYTTPEQTTKLMELGFEKPASIASVEPLYGMGGISVAKAYSIGELIEMLLNDDFGTKAFEFDGFNWWVDWDTADSIQQTSGVELVDALYDMIVKLKEEGVI